MNPPHQRAIGFPNLGANKVIIAMKGLPSTGKSEIAGLLGQWAKCQVFYIDDFLDTLSLERGYTAESPPPSGKEAQRLHRLALDALYKVALRHLQYLSRCVVIKSSLGSCFELDLLMRLVNDSNRQRLGSLIVIIVECRIKNEYKWRSRLGPKLWDGQEYVWYKARSWKDIEKAMDDDEDRIDSQAWDLHLVSLLKGKPVSFRRRITRLVLDPFDDLNNLSLWSTIDLTPDFLDAVRYLLMDQHKYIQDLDEDEDTNGKSDLYRGGYKALQFDELRRDLLEMELGNSRERSEYVCARATTKAGSCVFRYCEALPAEGSCGACGERVVSGQPAYTCHFCILTLHKSCAEKLDSNFLKRVFYPPYGSFFFYGLELHRFQEKRACKSCVERGERFSVRCESCLFETHLKYGVLPTIINHDCHRLHFLSINLAFNNNTCKACGVASYVGRYVCHICRFFYHFECVFMPGEVKHEHGGYEHVMKLMYSHDGMEQEDDHWCNACYKDMDPQCWFYCCQECPYYVIHARPQCVGKERIMEAIRNGNLRIGQIGDRLKDKAD